jgi:hypothetical protein
MPESDDGNLTARDAQASRSTHNFHLVFRASECHALPVTSIVTRFDCNTIMKWSHVRFRHVASDGRSRQAAQQGDGVAGPWPASAKAAIIRK